MLNNIIENGANCLILGVESSGKSTLMLQLVDGGLEQNEAILVLSCNHEVWIESQLAMIAVDRQSSFCSVNLSCDNNGNIDFEKHKEIIALQLRKMREVGGILLFNMELYDQVPPWAENITAGWQRLLNQLPLIHLAAQRIKLTVHMDEFPHCFPSINLNDRRFKFFVYEKSLRNSEMFYPSSNWRLFGNKVFLRCYDKFSCINDVDGLLNNIANQQIGEAVVSIEQNYYQTKLEK